MTYWLVALAAVLALQFAVLFGPPYVPTLKRQRKQALDMLALKPGQVFYDLGCGDGSLLKEAAQRGLTVVGYEINPIFALISRLRTLNRRKYVKIRIGSFWKADVSDADGIFVFLTTRHMNRLHEFMQAQGFNKPVKLVSFGFRIPEKKAKKSQGALFLYLYP